MKTSQHRPTRRPTNAQWVWLTGFQSRVVARLAGRAEAGEIGAWAVLELADHPERLVGLIARYSNPTRAADASFVNLARDWRRDQAIQRGEGARYGRRVAGFPVTITDEGDAIAFDAVDPAAIDPATCAADRDEASRAMREVPAPVAQGMQLDADGYTQTEAARLVGRSRSHLSRITASASRDLAARRGPM
jgi:hypothetical protein